MGLEDPFGYELTPYFRQITSRIGLSLARRLCRNQSDAVVPVGMTKQHQIEESNGTEPDLASDQHG